MGKKLRGFQIQETSVTRQGKINKNSQNMITKILN